MSDADSALASFHAIVRGRVQGVFFRDFVQRHARALGLTGYVRNLSHPQAVEVQAEGERRQLEKLLHHLRQGPPGSKVEKVELSWGDYSGDFPNFRVTY